MRKVFITRVWIAAGIIALLTISILFLTSIFNVLLLTLAGVLIALYFHGFAKMIGRHLHLSPRWNMTLSVSITVILVGAFIYFTGSTLQQQVAQLTNDMPALIQRVKDQLSQSYAGQQVLRQAESLQGKDVRATLQQFFRGTFGALGDIYIVLFLGIFFSAEPKTYIKGFLRLIPPAGRDDARRVVDRIGFTLTKWLKGKILSIFVVAILTAIGLLILRMPLAFVLSLIAGLLNFIPNFGPIIAMVPALLVAASQGMHQVLLVAGLYILVQVLESNVITPQIQKRLIQLPAALIIIAQLVMGTLSGGWGILLATPLIAILMVVIDELYVKKMGNEAH